MIRLFSASTSTGPRTRTTLNAASYASRTDVRNRASRASTSPNDAQRMRLVPGRECPPAPRQVHIFGPRARPSGRRRVAAVISSARSRIATLAHLVGRDDARRTDVGPVHVDDGHSPRTCTPCRTRPSAPRPRPLALKGTSGSRVDRSRTSSAPSTPAAHLAHRGVLSASSRSAGPITVSPRSRTCSRIPSSRKIRIDATAAAQAKGCPEYVRPPGNARSSNVAAIAGDRTTPPSGT